MYICSINSDFGDPDMPRKPADFEDFAVLRL